LRPWAQSGGVLLILGTGAHATHIRVPSAENFQPDGCVASATALYCRKPRSCRSKPGSVNPVVTSRLLRCGMTLLALSFTVDGSGVSGRPLMSTAFWRFTVPMIGLVVWNSVDGPNGSNWVGAVLTSVADANAC